MIFFVATGFRNGSEKPNFTRNYEHPYNVWKTSTTLTKGCAALKAFFTENRDYTVIVPIGNREHETCASFQQFKKPKSKGWSYRILMYNCNENDRVKIAEEFFRLFSERKVEVYNEALHKRHNNKQGICGALTWLEIISTFISERSAFDRKLKRRPLRPPK